MGFKQVELVPIQSSGPSALIPTAKHIICKAFQIVRTDTGANIVKAVLPAGSTILDVDVYGTAGSNAGTTAVINVGQLGVSQTSLVNAASVLGAAGTNKVVAPPLVGVGGLLRIEDIPVGPDIQITGQYAETGTVSSAGGPWTVVVRYVK